MAEAIDTIRQRVLASIAEEDGQLFDQEDVDSQIRDRDGLISCFLKQHRDQHGDNVDVGKVSEKLVETMKWRKTFGLSDSKSNEFPLEMWASNPMFVFEDDKYCIILYMMKSAPWISQRWSDLTVKFVVHFHNRVTLEAVHAGKQVIGISDASDFSVRNIDSNLHSTVVKLLDRHLPCLMDVNGVYGLPWALNSVVGLFLKFTMPYSMRKRFHAYTKHTIKDAFPDGYLPTLLGGQLEMTDVLKLLKINPKSLKTSFDDWKIEERESEKILRYCSQ